MCQKTNTERILPHLPLLSSEKAGISREENDESLTERALLTKPFWKTTFLPISRCPITGKAYAHACDIWELTKKR